MFTVNQKYLAKLKADFARLDPAIFDKGMWQICRALNKMPDIATSWCCSGHGEPESTQTDTFYIALHASSEKGERSIASLYDWWCKFLGTQVLTNEGMVDIHHTTKLEVCRLRSNYEEDEVVFTYKFTAIVDNDINNSERHIAAFVKAAERLGFLDNRKTA